MFPSVRLSRLRQSAPLRVMNQEIDLCARHLVQPIFVHEALDVDVPIPSLPGIAQRSINSAVQAAKEAADLGISAVILFGIPVKKDAVGSRSSDSDGVIQQTIRAIKKEVPNLVIIADCCLCEYTDHGHCGLFDERGNWDNDRTLQRLSEIAVSYAMAGVDIVAPSGMIDGMVSAIRTALDHGNHHHVSIMSYAVKYASAFYGPFRDAAGSGYTFVGDRKHHQLPPSQRLEALREADQDIQEGADYLIVKPAQHYMDMIRELHVNQKVMITAYQVSGEYAMVMNAAAQGIVDARSACLEILMGFRRAGAATIIAYNAIQVAKWLQERTCDDSI